MMISYKALIISGWSFRINTSEPPKRKDFSKAFNKYDIFDEICKNVRDISSCNPELKIIFVFVISHAEHSVFIFFQISVGIVPSAAIMLALNFFNQFVKCTDILGEKRMKNCLHDIFDNYFFWIGGKNRFYTVPFRRELLLNFCG